MPDSPAPTRTATPAQDAWVIGTLQVSLPQLLAAQPNGSATVATKDTFGKALAAQAPRFARLGGDTSADPAVAAARATMQTSVAAMTADAKNGNYEPAMTHLTAAAAAAGEMETALAAAALAAQRTARTAKLAEVDAALTTMNAAVDAVGAPFARSAATPAITPLTARRDALAAAATEAELTTQLAAAPALLTDIAVVRNKAQTDKTEWTRLQAVKAKVEKGLGSAKSWTTWFDGGNVRTGLEAEAAAIETDLKDLATSADMTRYTAGLTAAQTKVASLLSRATSGGQSVYATKKIQQLDKWAPLYRPIGDPNPVQLTSAALTRRKATAVGNALTVIGNDASAAAKDAKTAYATWETAKRYITQAESGLAAMPPEPRGAVVAQRDALLGKISHAFTSTATCAALQTALVPLKAEAQVLQAQTLDVGKQTADVTASLTEAKKAIDGLATGPAKVDLTTRHDALQARLTAAGTTTPLTAQKQALLDLGKDAITLVEDASKAAFTAEAATPEGKAKIDKLISDMGGTTDDPTKQAVCKAAIAACYKVPLEIPEGMPVKTLPSIYQMMTKVPAAHLEGLTAIGYENDPLMGSSYYGSNKVVLNKIGDGSGTRDMVEQAPVAAGATPKSVRVNYFNDTTLHELGHHVDARNKIMDSNMSNAAYGGWKSENIDTVAEAYVASVFASFTGGTKKPTRDDLLALVRSVLSTGTASKPADAAKPLGSLLDDWDAIVASQGYKDCAAIRDPDKTNPWTKAHPCGDRSYQEAYSGNWVSYLVAERAKGISDYQWRAPAEWFAEQYSYYRLQADKPKPAALAAYLTS